MRANWNYTCLLPFSKRELRQLCDNFPHIYPKSLLYVLYIYFPPLFQVSRDAISGFVSFSSRKRKRERENVSKFHLYLCDDAKKHEKRERYPFTVKNREGETNQKPLIRFINRNMECTRWGEGKRNIGVKRGMREGEKVIDRHLGRISRWRWFTGGEEIREKWKELK